MKRKSIILFSVIFLILLLIGAGTYAYWTWNSNVSKNVIFNTAGMEDMIVYDEGNSYFIGNFMPTASFCESTNNTISFYKMEEASEHELYATINLDINSIGTNIANSNDVYWVLTEGNNSITCEDLLASSSVVNYGTFTGKSVGNTITLASNIEITTTEKEFTVWIWIDSNGSNLSSLSGETIDTNIWTQVDMADGIQEWLIEFDANGGSGAPEDQIKTKDVILTLSNTVPTRDGYVFLGWSDDQNATSATYVAGGDYTANESVTLYAIWEASE